MNVDPDPVLSASDARVRDFADLTDADLRQRWEHHHGVFIAEGHLVIERCVQRGMPVLAVLTTQRWLPRLSPVLAVSDARVLIADESVVKAITGYRVHRGALATVARPAPRDVDQILQGPGDVLVLEELVDPTNVGLAIRSAVVQGITDVIVSPGCADPLYRKAVKSSMGTVLGCRWARSADWPTTLGDIATSRHLIALAPDGESELQDGMAAAAQDRVALAFGSEGPGLSDLALRAARRRCRIPMAGEGDSLNVAASVAVACYARSRSMHP